MREEFDEQNGNYIDVDNKRKDCASMATMFSFIALIFLICNIFLAGFQYNQADQRWSHEDGYFILGVLEITYVVIVFVITVFGIIVFLAAKGSNVKIKTVRNITIFIFIYLFIFFFR